jgi:1,4-dihydroxy-6-naphthoate synthase
MPATPRAIRFGHSPDPDDAFMAYGFACGAVRVDGLELVQVYEDIESLNRRAVTGEIEVSAVSFHAYAHITDHYALLPFGASMGDGYGPIVVAREPIEANALRRETIAVPGTLTSAFLALGLYLGGGYEHVVVPFDRIPDAVAAGDVAAGLLIHEGQLTYARQGLVKIADLGEWWGGRMGLMLPLGGNVIRKNLGPAMIARLGRAFRGSIHYALAHRAEALEYALGFGRGIEPELADRFISMYVNEHTLGYGPGDREAVETFLDRGHAAGLLPCRVAIEFAEVSEP